MTEQKPIVWVFESTGTSVDWRWYCSMHRPEERPYRRNITPVFAPPATDPAVEAARRKALRAIFAALDEYPWACDTCTVVPTGMTRSLTYGILRDLVGQPRKYPDRAIRGYDNDGPPGPHPVFGKREPEPVLKVSATIHETHVNTADLAQKEAIDLVAEGLEAARAARTHTDAMWWLMTDGGKEKWRDQARRAIARVAKAL